jgi:integrase
VKQAKRRAGDMATKKIDTRYMYRRGLVWYIKITTPDGRRLVQSTGTGDLTEARAVRDRMIEPLTLGTERARLSAVQAAIGTVDARLDQIADARPATSIRHGWQAYLDQQNRPDSGPSTLARYEGWFEAFARWMDDQHSVVVEMRHVAQIHADEYARHVAKLVSPTTFNRTINTLSLVWRVLEQSARITSNPWKQIARKRFTVHSRREMTVEELGRVCAAATGETRILIALGVYCGLRLGDAALLRWADVDMIKGIISLVPQKTARRSQKRVTLPIHPALITMLAETEPPRRKGYVMPSVAERYQQYDAALSRDVAKLFESVGIVTSAAMEGTMRNRPECGYHSLRHTFVSLCAAGGVPQSVVQSLVGHGSPAMTMHYTHVGTEAAARAVALLPDLSTPATATPPTTGAAGAVLAMLGGLDKDGLQAVIQAAKSQLKNGGSK